MSEIEMINYRTARVEDSTHIMKLVNQLGYFMKLDELEENLENILSDEKHYMCVAVNGIGEVVGYAHISEFKVAYSKYGAEFQELCVDKDYWGRGIGKELVELVKAWAWENGCHDIIGRTNVIRTEAHKFYRHVGFDFIKKQCVIHMDKK